MLPAARQLRIGLIAGLGAQWEHIQTIREQINLLERLGNNPDDAAVLGPWRDADVARGPSEGPGDADVDGPWSDDEAAGARCGANE